MELDEIKELITLLQNSGLKKLCLKRGDFEVLLEKESLPLSTTPIITPPQYSERKVEELPEKGSERAEFVISPMVGTFYAAPAPDQSSFVKKGDRVDKDTVVCIIEAMKVMNEVKAGMSGIIEEILCENAQPVEYGTKLFRII